MDVKDILPHREPFLMVDEVVEVTETYAKGIKNVHADESYFKGHFPGLPVMPGVLILESIAQVAGLSILSQTKYKGSIGFLVGVDNARFRARVVPGDKLVLEATLLKRKGKICIARGKASVGDAVVCEADMLFAVDKKE
jgi:3-hydroxyacyl-[acyl-carrier-protein] dehydratase